MHIAISGSSGLVGSALCSSLPGHQVTRLVRSDAGQHEILWDLEQGRVETEKLESVDAIVHLAGENLSEGRWNASKKEAIRHSRVEGTRLLSDALAKLSGKPPIFICASAIGYYGNRGHQVCDERTAPGGDFLADVCKKWETATRPAAEAGLRVVNLRIGVVLSKSGGALAKMLFPFKVGVGGQIGNGDQFISWIVLDELINVILFCLEQESLEGPVNAVSPHPVTNREFTKTLGKVLSRPTMLPLPGFAARLAFGEMADALLLSSTRVAPNKLEENGYRFAFPQLEPSLRHELLKS